MQPQSITDMARQKRPAIIYKHSKAPVSFDNGGHEFSPDVPVPASDLPAHLDPAQPKRARRGFSPLRMTLGDQPPTAIGVLQSKGKRNEERARALSDLPTPEDRARLAEAFLKADERDHFEEELQRSLCDSMSVRLYGCVGDCLPTERRKALMECAAYTLKVMQGVE